MLEFLLLIAAFSAVLVIKQIIAQRQCVSDHTLRKFMSKRLKEAERDNVIAHLGLCEKCQNRLHEINFGKKDEDHLIDN